MKESRKSDPPHFLYNLVSRTLVDFSKKSASYAGSPIRIRPAITPDMLPNTFRNWEVCKGSAEKRSQRRQYNDNSNYNISQPSGLYFPASDFSVGVHPIHSNSISSRKVKPEIGGLISQSNGKDDNNNNNSHRLNFLNRLQMRPPAPDSSHTTIDNAERKQKIHPNPKYPNSETIGFKSNEKKPVEETITATTTNVTVHIGRIQVRAQLPKGSRLLDDSSIPSRISPPLHYSLSHLSLNDYLKQRSEGRF